MSGNTRHKRRSRNESGASDKSNDKGSDKSSSEGGPATKASKPDIGLFMECTEDELSEAQKKFYDGKQKAFDDVMKQLEEIAKKGATVTPNSDNSVTFKVTDSSTMGPLVPSTTATPATTVTSSVSGGVATYTCPPGYRLLMDPKTGRIIGSVPVASLAGGASTHTVNTLTPAPAISRPPALTAQTQSRGGRGARGAGGRGGLAARASPGGRGRGAAAMHRGSRVLGTRGASLSARPITPSTPAAAKTGSSPGRGAPGAGSSPAPMIVDLTDPSVEPVGAPPMRKSFPALTVQARAQRVVPGASAKRSELDTKVKGLLVLTPAKFTEWLIQNGLVRSEQFEEVNGVKNKLKLGMYSDGKRFAASGGYVWLHSAGSSTKYTSVLKGSIFEIAPSNALKLIYHWCCQTTINNVIQWVKVDNAFVDKFFTMLRAVASVTVQDKVINMGGPGQVIEIGVISLGTSTQEGNKREVRVEVLGVLERSSRNIRIRASEPQSGANQTERFRKIFEMLPVWVNPASKIYTDYSVDRETLSQLGYKNVVQCSLQNTSASGQHTNIQVMDYLKKIVPKMFQNTLSSLSNATLQQFLDELSFREVIGQYPLASFNNMVEMISTLTQYTATRNEGMEAFLKRVAANPFLDWRSSVGGKPPSVSVRGVSPGAQPPSRSSSASPSPALKRPLSSTTPPTSRPPSAGPNPGIRGPPGRKIGVPEEDPETLFAKRMKIAKDFVELETYYYGTLQGEETILAAEFKADMAFKCQVCKKVFMNNIEFMKHLHLHIESERQTAIDFTDLSQCKYCYKDFENSIKMDEHMDTTHIIKGFSHVCQICNSGFTTVGGLVIHMSKEHTRAELPYACQVCEHRTSCHKSIIEHFTEIHDRTDKLQCPLCLKTYSLFNDKGYNSAAAQSYMVHLQKHENLKKKKMSCKKCCLEFVNVEVLKHHQEKDHVSYKDFAEIDTSQFLLEAAPTRIPKPEEKSLRVAPKKTGPSKPLQTQYAFASVNLEDMAIYDLEKERCCECKRPMTQAGHYTAYLCCTKCRYSTCCSRAINIHGILFHGQTTPWFDLGKPVIVDKEMYCVCGFWTKSGNKMARHLGTQGCSTAYSSLEDAGEARKDKDLPPIEKLTPPASPTPPPPEHTKSRTKPPAESAQLSTITLSREPRGKSRKVAPTLLKEDFESDPDDPDSDSPPNDGDDADDDNYVPEEPTESYTPNVSKPTPMGVVVNESETKDDESEGMEVDNEDEKQEEDSQDQAQDADTQSQNADKDDNEDDKVEEEKEKEEEEEKEEKEEEEGENNDNTDNKSSADDQEGEQEQEEEQEQDKEQEEGGGEEEGGEGGDEEGEQKDQEETAEQEQDKEEEQMETD